MTEAEIAALAEDIARYLQGHPSAADSADGILRWWLPRQRFQDSATAVRRALDLLVERRAVTRTVMGDGTVVYASTAPVPLHHG